LRPAGHGTVARINAGRTLGALTVLQVVRINAAITGPNAWKPQRARRTACSRTLQAQDLANAASTVSPAISVSIPRSSAWIPILMTVLSARCRRSAFPLKCAPTALLPPLAPRTWSATNGVFMGSPVRARQSSCRRHRHSARRRAGRAKFRAIAELAVASFSSSLASARGHRRVPSLAAKKAARKS